MPPKKYPALPEPPNATMLQRLKDLGLDIFAHTPVAMGEALVGLADLPTGGLAGKGLQELGYDPQETHRLINELMSEERQYEEQRQSQEFDKSFLGGLSYAARNPAPAIGSIIQSIPLMYGGRGVGQGLMKVAPKVPALLAGAFGEGTIAAGMGVEQIRQSNESGMVTPEQYLLGLGSGAVTGALGYLGGKVAGKLGLEDIDIPIAKMTPEEHAAKVVEEGARKSLIRRIGEGAIQEGLLEELPQSMQEQVAQNIATGKSWDEGLSEAAGLGLLTGAAMGGAVQGRSSVKFKALNAMMNHDRIKREKEAAINEAKDKLKKDTATKEQEHQESVVVGKAAVDLTGNAPTLDEIKLAENIASGTQQAAQSISETEDEAEALHQTVVSSTVDSIEQAYVDEVVSMLAPFKSELNAGDEFESTIVFAARNDLTKKEFVDLLASAYGEKGADAAKKIYPKLQKLVDKIAADTQHAVNYHSEGMTPEQYNEYLNSLTQEAPVQQKSKISELSEYKVFKDDLPKIISGNKSLLSNTQPIESGEFSLSDGTEITVEGSKSPVSFKRLEELGKAEEWAKLEGYDSVAHALEAGTSRAKSFINGKRNLYLAKIIKVDRTKAEKAEARTKAFREHAVQAGFDARDRDAKRDNLKHEKEMQWEYTESEGIDRATLQFLDENGSPIPHKKIKQIQARQFDDGRRGVLYAAPVLEDGSVLPERVVTERDLRAMLDERAKTFKAKKKANKADINEQILIRSKIDETNPVMGDDLRAALHEERAKEIKATAYTGTDDYISNPIDKAINRIVAQADEEEQALGILEGEDVYRDGEAPQQPRTFVGEPTEMDAEMIDLRRKQKRFKRLVEIPVESRMGIDEKKLSARIENIMQVMDKNPAIARVHPPEVNALTGKEEKAKPVGYATIIGEMFQEAARYYQLSSVIDFVKIEEGVLSLAELNEIPTSLEDLLLFIHQGVVSEEQSEEYVGKETPIFLERVWQAVVDTLPDEDIYQDDKLAMAAFIKDPRGVAKFIYDYFDYGNKKVPKRLTTDDVHGLAKEFRKEFGAAIDPNSMYVLAKAVTSKEFVEYLRSPSAKMQQFKGQSDIRTLYPYTPETPKVKPPTDEQVAEKRKLREQQAKQVKKDSYQVFKNVVETINKNLIDPSVVAGFYRALNALADEGFHRKAGLFDAARVVGKMKADPLVSKSFSVAKETELYGGKKAVQEVPFSQMLSVVKRLWTDSRIESGTWTKNIVKESEIGHLNAENIDRQHNVGSSHDQSVEEGGELLLEKYWLSEESYEYPAFKDTKNTSGYRVRDVEIMSSVEYEDPATGEMTSIENPTQEQYDQIVSDSKMLGTPVKPSWKTLRNQGAKDIVALLEERGSTKSKNAVVVPSKSSMAVGDAPVYTVKINGKDAIPANAVEIAKARQAGDKVEVLGGASVWFVEAYDPKRKKSFRGKVRPEQLRAMKAHPDIQIKKSEFRGSQQIFGFDLTTTIYPLYRFALQQGIVTRDQIKEQIMVRAAEISEINEEIVDYKETMGTSADKKYLQILYDKKNEIRDEMRAFDINVKSKLVVNQYVSSLVADPKYFDLMAEAYKIPGMKAEDYYQMFMESGMNTNILRGRVEKLSLEHKLNETRKLFVNNAYSVDKEGNRLQPKPKESGSDYAKKRLANDKQRDLFDQVKANKLNIKDIEDSVDARMVGVAIEIASEIDETVVVPITKSEKASAKLSEETKAAQRRLEEVLSRGANTLHSAKLPVPTEMIFTDQDGNLRPMKHGQFEEDLVSQNPNMKVGRLYSRKANVLFKSIAKIFGADLVIVSDTYYQSRYISKASDGRAKIIVNVNAPTSFSRIFAHELFHHVVAKSAGDEYKTFRKAVINVIGIDEFNKAVRRMTIGRNVQIPEEGISDMEYLIKFYAEKGISEEEIFSEIFAQVAYTEGFYTELAKTLSGKKVAQKIILHLMEKVQQVYGVLNDNKGFTYEQGLLLDPDQMHELNRLYASIVGSALSSDKGLREGVIRFAKGSDGKGNRKITYNLSNVSDEYLAKEEVEINNTIKSIQDSMLNRPEIGPEAEAAVGAKNRYIAQLQYQLKRIESERNKRKKSQSPASDEAINEIPTPEEVEAQDRQNAKAVHTGFGHTTHEQLVEISKNSKSWLEGVWSKIFPKGFKDRKVVMDQIEDHLESMREWIKKNKGKKMWADFYASPAAIKYMNLIAFGQNKQVAKVRYQVIRKHKAAFSKMTTEEKIAFHDLFVKGLVTEYRYVGDDGKEKVAWKKSDVPYARKYERKIVNVGYQDINTEEGRAIYKKFNYTDEQLDALVAFKQVADEAWETISKIDPTLEKQEYHYGQSIKWYRKNGVELDNSFDWITGDYSKLEGRKQFMKEQNRDMTTEELRERYNLEFLHVDPDRLLLDYIHDAYKLIYLKQAIGQAMKTGEAKVFYVNNQGMAAKEGYRPIHDRSLQILQNHAAPYGFKLQKADGSFVKNDQGQDTIYMTEEEAQKAVESTFGESKERLSIVRHSYDRNTVITGYQLIMKRGDGADGENEWVTARFDGNDYKNAEEALTYARENASGNESFYLKTEEQEAEGNVVAMIFLKEDMAHMMNNLLAEDYIRNRSFLGVSGRKVMDWKNQYTSIEFAVSLFHAMTIGQEMIASTAAWRYGRMRHEGGFKLREMLKAYNPKQMVKDAREISALLEAVLADRSLADEPAVKKKASELFGTDNVDILDTIIQYYDTGGLTGMDKSLRSEVHYKGEMRYKDGEAKVEVVNGEVVITLPKGDPLPAWIPGPFTHGPVSMKAITDSFKGVWEQQLRENPNHKLSAAFKTGKFALMEGTTAWLMEQGIPRVKMAMWAREYTLELDRQKDALESGDTTKEFIARNTMKFIEDRFGEVNWMNTWMNPTYKTALQFAFRSFTWFTGSWNALAKAGIDIGKLGWFKLKGEEYELTSRGLWAMNAIVAHMMAVGLITTMFTIFSAAQGGAADDDDEIPLLTRLLFPRTDPLDPEKRVAVPSYVTEWYKLFRHLGVIGDEFEPSKLISGRFNSILGKGIDIWNNSDFRGVAIRNEGDSFLMQLVDSLLHLAPMPISVSVATKNWESKGFDAGDLALSSLGFVDAPAAAKRSAAANKAFEIRRREYKGREISEDEMTFKDSVKRAAYAYSQGNTEPLKNMLRKGEISRKVFDNALTRLPRINNKKNPRFVDPLSSALKGLTIEGALEVWKFMSDAEKKTHRQMILKKYQNMIQRSYRSKNYKNEIHEKMKDLKILK